jgi:hypothetical protein
MVDNSIRGDPLTWVNRDEVAGQQQIRVNVGFVAVSYEMGTLR